MSTIVFADTPAEFQPEVIVAPNAVLRLIAYLNQRHAARGLVWRVGTEWENIARQILVSRAGGARANLVFDRPQMLVEVYGSTQDESEDHAQLVEAWITALPGLDFGVSKVEWLSGPVAFPDAIGRKRVQMSFYLRVRMQGE